MPALNGTGSNGNITLSDVVNWINTQQADITPVSSRMTASATNDGRLSISLPSGNTTDDIRLGLGANGTPADLQSLGFDTSLHVSGNTTDDLLVFVTGDAGTQVNVSAQFQSINSDMKQALRQSPLSVEFTTAIDYRIVDTRTKTVLAERTLTPTQDSSVPSLSFRGLKLEFSTYPKAGDQFTIDGNTDGIGNNEAMLQIVDLENTKLMPGGLTMTEAYIESVSQVGNVARQADIAKQALTVVHQQAVEARDAISGVSLDEEASALVRFQQAYQANAKVMQTSMTLFESILQVR